MCKGEHGTCGVQYPPIDDGDCCDGFTCTYLGNMTHMGSLGMCIKEGVVISYVILFVKV